MFLALKEMRRAKARFALLMAAIGLLVFLILFQQTLQNGLLDAFVGAVRTQSAPVLAFSVDGRRNLQGSIITPELEQQIRGTDGLAQAGRIGQRSLPAVGERLGRVLVADLEGRDHERHAVGNDPVELVDERLGDERRRAVADSGAVAVHGPPGGGRRAPAFGTVGLRRSGRAGARTAYFAYSTARVSRMTVTLIWPG